MSGVEEGFSFSAGRNLQNFHLESFGRSSAGTSPMPLVIGRQSRRGSANLPACSLRFANFLQGTLRSLKFVSNLVSFSQVLPLNIFTFFHFSYLINR